MVIIDEPFRVFSKRAYRVYFFHEEKILYMVFELSCYAAMSAGVIMSANEVFI